jgi:Ca-activated chloride channel family protein
VNEPLEWLRPAWAWAPAVGLLVLALGWWGLARRRRERARFVERGQLARFLPGFSGARAAARVALAALATVLLGLSLIGPVRGHTLREVKTSGVDLVVCIDTSRSMLARDVRPDRLTRAKREVLGLLDRPGSDRIALIAFSGDAREVAPLTHDRVALKQLLERVTPDDNRMGGTSLASALERALAMFDGRTGSSEAIALVTDGEDLAGEGLRMAQQAQARGIRVYVVGVGTEGGGKIPIADERGGERFLADRAGEEVVSRMDRASLRRLAEETGGEFLAVDESPTPLEALYDRRITHLEGRELVGGKERIPHDRYQWTLALALACMLGEAGLRERRRAAGGRP